MHVTIQSVEARLRQDKKGYEMNRQVCMECGRTPPIDARNVIHATNTELHRQYCMVELRVAEYFAILAKEELWPSVKVSETLSWSDLVIRVTCAKTDNKHSCGAGSRCPLSRELERLCDKVARLDQEVGGFCLHCVKRRDWDGRQKCTCTSTADQ